MTSVRLTRVGIVRERVVRRRLVDRIDPFGHTIEHRLADEGALAMVS